MKIYFSMWAYRDPNRVGYDSIDADYYLEKPFGFGRDDSETAYYDADIPDGLTEEEKKAIGEKAVALLKTGYYSARRAVDMVLAEEKKD